MSQTVSPDVGPVSNRSSAGGPASGRSSTGSLRALLGKIDALCEHLRRDVAQVREYVAAIPKELSADELRDALAAARVENAQLRDQVEQLQRFVRT